MKEKAASFLVPLLVAVILLYQVLSELQIAITHSATLFMIGITLAVGATLGLLAAYGPSVIRIATLTLCTLVVVDVTFHITAAFDGLSPDIQTQVARDKQRVSDLHQIQAALDEYAEHVGPLPTPSEMREGIGPRSFWAGWWDVSSDRGFLDFLADEGTLRVVPRDPLNVTPSDGDPRRGQHYVYYVVPAGYQYSGGTCAPDRWHYLIAATDLEEETTRPPRKFGGSGCECLWKGDPNYFQQHFDYVLCGSFAATPETRARAAKRRAGRAAEAAARREAKIAAELAEKHNAGLRRYVRKDQRRVTQLLNIDKALRRHLEKAGRLPAPSEYGEADTIRPGFWQGQWDLSTIDGDRDGKPFLDFLSDNGTLPSVPLDPDNERGTEDDPRGGRQYVYFVLPPGSNYEGGPSEGGPDHWYYMLAITDLQSTEKRPPEGFPASGCNALWRNLPNFFQHHFDYVVCGSFVPRPAAPPSPQAETKPAT